MPLEERPQTDAKVIDKYNLLTLDSDTTTYQMKLTDRVLVVTNTYDGATITLPPVSGAKGKDFHIALLAASTYNVTINDKSDCPAIWNCSIVLDAAGEETSLLSNGVAYIEIAADWTPTRT